MSDQFGNDGTGGFDWQTARINAEQAEIERLREQIKVISGADGTCYAALWDETEKRVNAEKEIEQLHTSYGLLCDDYKQLLIDNEHLRGELDAASLEVQRLERVWETSTQKEIERLHGMLQICMDRWIPFREVAFRQKIEEALRHD